MASSSTKQAKADTNPRGIPAAPFIDDVEDYVSSREEVEPTLRNFQEMISKYQFMQTNTERRAQGLREKIPDIKKTLTVIEFLKTRAPDSKPLETLFELNDTLYTKAHVQAPQEVYLWLGANVMLAYPIPEAEELLHNKLSTAQSSLDTCDEDLLFLREQITTMEVATARVYNWDVQQRRKEKDDTEGESKKSGQKSNPDG